MFAFGIEHEVAFLRPDGRFADFANTTFAEFEQIIAALPLYPDDYPQLYVGDAGIRKKRWYIEGVERFSEDGSLIGFDGKGIEIRTTPQPSIQAAIADLAASQAQLAAAAAQFGFTLITVAFHPYRTGYSYDPPLNAYERQLHQDEPEYVTEHMPMITFGPDFNFSSPELSVDQVVDIGRKLTYYSPALVPFSLNAPIYAGQPWGGLSIRTAFRTGARPAARVYLADAADLIVSRPILTKRARHPQEVGRIEFKAFDSCADLELYAGLLALLKGLALDHTLPGRATTPDAALHQHAARFGFGDDSLAALAATVLAAASSALEDDPDLTWLEPLATALVQRACPAQALLDALEQAGSVEQLLASWKG
jgi:gamma-glutamyl:cysteine ligase YbdK (ATP-grasp superfamily)